MNDEPILPGYKRTAVGIIPEDWDAVDMGQLFSFKNGLNKSKEYFGFGTPIVNYMDVYQHSGLYSSDLHGRVSLSHDEIKAYEVRKGDVFFTRTSETLDEVGIASVMLDAPIDTVFSGFVLRARTKDESLDNRYKRYCFSTRSVRDQIVSRGSYTTRALTNGRALSQVVILRPLLPEQRAIAGALSDMDELLAVLERLITKKRAIKRGAMQALLTGRIRLSGFLRKSGYKHTEVGIIPEDWDLCTFGKLVNIRNNKVNPALVDPSTPCVELENIGQGTGHLIGYSLAEQSTSTKYRFIKKDVLYGRLRAYLRKFWLAEFDGICTTEIWPLKPVDDQIRNEFLFQVVQTDRFNEAASVAYGTHMPRADWGVISNLSIPLPDPAEQTAIAEVLSDMDDEIEAIEQRRAKLRAIKQGMMQELLTGKTRLVQPQKQAQEVNA